MHQAPQVDFPCSEECTWDIHDWILLSSQLLHGKLVDLHLLMCVVDPHAPQHRVFVRKSIAASGRSAGAFELDATSRRGSGAGG